MTLLDNLLQLTVLTVETGVSLTTWASHTNERSISNNNNNNNIYSFVTPLLASLKGAKANTESIGVIC